MARPTRVQPGLFEPPPPPVQMPELVRVEAVAQLRILLDEAAAVPSKPAQTLREVTGDDQNHG